jgi:hypothetical protein
MVRRDVRRSKQEAPEHDLAEERRIERLAYQHARQ